ncbi:GWT1-domain-containing protein [Mycena rosella]|uniref:GPI-anchored wall transfer protein 1 n=1 Tax=Mycena rosella TaxID=1033263 RepID=A0AAD7CYW0_MYCRO|nr:GWT1-domain-containing protein [Mycena rosella]
MDLGVGSFVFSNGMVSAILLLKDPHHLSAPQLPKVLTVTRKTPDHRPQRHLCPTRQGHRVTRTQNRIRHALELLHHPRPAAGPLIRTVPVSILGVSLRYLTIHLLGLSMGTILLLPIPSFFLRLLKACSTPTDLLAPRQNDKTATELMSFVSLLYLDEGVLRQTVNLAYALWIVAFNTFFILLYLVLDMLFSPLPAIRKGKAPPLAVPPAAAPLLTAINTNGLPLFLLGNAGTGLVNLLMHRMYAGTATAMGVLAVYALVVCIVA